MEPEEPTKCRFRGEEMDIADARMELNDDELREIEVTLSDGTVTRPYRDHKPTITVDKDGVPRF
jgi:hypothetical protein